MSSRTCPSCTLDPLLLHHAHVVIENDAWTVKQREIDALRAENERLTERVDELEMILAQRHKEIDDWKAGSDEEARAGDEARTEIGRLKVENERLRTALLRLVELGEDDGSAPDTAWKDAFTDASVLLGRDKCR